MSVVISTLIYFVTTFDSLRERRAFHDGGDFTVDLSDCVQRHSVCGLVFRSKVKQLAQLSRQIMQTRFVQGQGDIQIHLEPDHRDVGERSGELLHFG